MTVFTTLAVLPCLIGAFWAVGVVLGALMFRGPCMVARELNRVSNTALVVARMQARRAVSRETEAMFIALEQHRNKAVQAVYQAHVRQHRTLVQLARPAVLVPSRAWSSFDNTAQHAMRVSMKVLAR